jgi:hypothetical protein
VMLYGTFRSLNEPLVPTFITLALPKLRQGTNPRDISAWSSYPWGCTGQWPITYITRSAIIIIIIIIITIIIIIIITT